MSEGPNYEALFRKMQCLTGKNPEDCKTIVRYLRFFQGTDEYQAFFDHYVPQLPAAMAKEFLPVTSTAETEVEAKADEPTITSPKKKGRSPKA